jgi:hypothetical protein
LIVILILSILIILSLYYYSRSKIIQEEQKREELLNELKILKKKDGQVVDMDKNAALNKEKLEIEIDKKINETDWNV